MWDVKGRVEVAGGNSGIEWNQPERWEGESAKTDPKIKSHMGELPWGVCMWVYACILSHCEQFSAIEQRNEMGCQGWDREKGL